MSHTNRPALDAFRVAHLDFSAEHSIDRKLKAQAEAARRLGLPLDFIVFSPAAQPEAGANLELRRLPGDGWGQTVAPKLQWPFRLRWAARACAGRGYHVIILRYPKLPVGWRSFLRGVGVPVITEHHTDEVAELRGDGGAWRQLAAELETRLRKRFLRTVAGIVGVTPEITARIRSQAPQAQATTISNGVDVAGIPFTGFTPFDGKTLRLVFVASRFVGWHGLDRLLDGLNHYRGPVAVELDLLGLVPADLAARIAQTDRRGVRIRPLGALYGANGDEPLARANLAVASLAVYRKNMAQACTLKTREYAARGIPFVYGYEDPDVPNDCEFALRVENNETPVDVGQWVRFAERMASRPGLAQRMRQFALERMDWALKVRAMVEFAKTVQAARIPSPSDPPRHLG